MKTVSKSLLKLYILTSNMRLELEKKKNYLCKYHIVPSILFKAVLSSNNKEKHLCAAQDSLGRAHYRTSWELVGSHCAPAQSF